MRRLAATVVAAILLVSCSDTASSLRSKIAAATADLDRQSGDATKVVAYVPSPHPYTIIFFPERRVFESELVARGVDPVIAKRVFHDLSRFGVGEKERPMVVVAEPGKPPSFQSYYGRDIVYIDDLMIVRKPSGGEVQLTLQKRGDTYYLTDAR